MMLVGPSFILFASVSFTLRLVGTVGALALFMVKYSILTPTITDELISEVFRCSEHRRHKLRLPRNKRRQHTGRGQTLQMHYTLCSGIRVNVNPLQAWCLCQCVDGLSQEL